MIARIWRGWTRSADAWDSLEAVKAFAGERVEQAVFYPEDDRFLVAREVTAAHYEIVES